jgi:alkylmercury lyase-like protein
MPDTDLDREVRIAIARSIKTRGRIPTIAAVAADIGKDVATVDASFARMIEGRVFLPRKDSHEIRVYNPFCVERTDFFVTAAGRIWFAIDAWDAMGIPAALGESGVIETHCADCNEALVVEVDADGGTELQTWTVMQVGVPARDFWKDIDYTMSTILLFHSEEHAERWRERAKPPASSVLAIEQAAGLAHAWYRNKLDADWRRFTTEEAETIFDVLGLDAEFWRLSA